MLGSDQLTDLGEPPCKKRQTNEGDGSMVQAGTSQTTTAAANQSNTPQCMTNSQGYSYDPNQQAFNQGYGPYQQTGFNGYYGSNWGPDPALSGSFNYNSSMNPVANIPSSYAQFANGLPTSFGPVITQFPQQTQPAQQTQQVQPPPPPLQQAIGSSIRGRRKGAPAKPRHTLDDPFKQQTVNQLNHLDNQFKSVVDSLSAIQSWLQIPSSVTPVHASPVTGGIQHTTPVTVQAAQAVGTQLTSQTATNTSMNNAGDQGTSRHANGNGCMGTDAGQFNNDAHLPPGNQTGFSSGSSYTDSINHTGRPLLTHMGPTYTNAGSRPRMSTGFEHISLNIKEGRGRYGGVRGQQPNRGRRGGNILQGNVTGDTNDPLLACIAYKPGISGSGQQNGSQSVNHSLFDGGSSPSAQNVHLQDLQHCYGGQIRKENNVCADMSALLLPSSVRDGGAQSNLNQNLGKVIDFTNMEDNLCYTLPNSGRREERKIVSGGMPLGWNVEESIKEAIWNDDFVDFSDLIDKEGTSKPKATPESDPNSLPNPSKYKRQIRTIRDWDKAFSTYMNLYLRKPGNIRHLPHLITYSNDLKTMAENGINFLEYDELFRKERASQAKAGIEPWSWNVFRQDNFNNIQLQAIAEKLQLSARKWLESPRPRFQQHYQHYHFQQPTFPNPRRFGLSNSLMSHIPPGFCFDYHSYGKRCMKHVCTFRHYCPCGRGPHPLYLCRSSGAPYRGGDGVTRQVRERYTRPFTFRQ